MNLHTASGAHQKTTVPITIISRIFSQTLPHICRTSGHISCTSDFVCMKLHNPSSAHQNISVGWAAGVKIRHCAVVLPLVFNRFLKIFIGSPLRRVLFRRPAHAAGDQDQSVGRFFQTASRPLRRNFFCFMMVSDGFLVLCNVFRQIFNGFLAFVAQQISQVFSFEFGFPFERTVLVEI